MTSSALHKGYAARTQAVLAAVCLLGASAPAVGQDYSAFETGLTDCVNFISLRAAGPINFLGGAQQPDVDEDGVSGTVLYPAGSSGSNWDFGMSYEYEIGNSLNPPAWTCAGSGTIAPTWPEFTAFGWVSTDARIRAAGFVELNFPGGPKAYANCNAEVPDAFITLSPSTGDRVVFAALTGPAAQAYCTSLGVK